MTEGPVRHSWERKIRLPGGRTLTATPVLNTYWRFACLRQQIFHRRVSGEPPPWTDNPILSRHRFTNAYRASDRVSQYLIRHVIYQGDASPQEVVFRTLLFKLFNRIETWEAIVQEAGPVVWSPDYLKEVDRVLTDRMARGMTVYTSAYVMPTPNLGAARKHSNHLLLLERMMAANTPDILAQAGSLERVYLRLLSWPSFGKFLAFQLAIDLNYSEVVNFSEMDFVVAGPGAVSGIQKCFADLDGLDYPDVIRAVTDLAESEFERLELPFQDLWGRPLQLIDCQNLFCETDKYARVAHPDVQSSRARIKQRYRPVASLVPQQYPPKWGLVVPEAVDPVPDFPPWCMEET